MPPIHRKCGPSLYTDCFIEASYTVAAFRDRDSVHAGIRDSGRVVGSKWLVERVIA